MEINKDHLIEILKAGHLAPSADNSQPWIFEVVGNKIYVHHDLKKAHTNHLYNIDYFADYVSLGCVLENIAISAESFGYIANLSDMEIRETGFCATMELEKTHVPVHSPLSEHIARRKTNRRAYSTRVIPENIKQQMLELADKRGGKLHWVDDPAQIARLADVIAIHDVILWEDEALRKNLLRMLRIKNKKHTDGLPLASLELGVRKHLFSPMIHLANLISPLWKVMAFNSIRHTKSNIKKSGALGLITLPKKHHPNTYVEGGRILQSLWINLTVHDIYIQPIFGSLALILNKKLEKGGLSKKHRRIRDEISDFFHTFYPDLESHTAVALFRIGYAQAPTSVSGRRDLKHVLKNK